jgi:WD40 repeat protein
MDGTVKLWDTTAVDAAATPPQRDWINACAISGDDDLIVTASSQMHVQVWNARQAGAPTFINGHTGSIRGCTIVPGSNHIVSASADKTVRVWDVTGKVIATLAGHRDWVNACDASRDARLLVSGSSDKTLRFWDTRTWSRRLTIMAHGDSVNACRFSLDGGRVASASSDGTVKLWDVATLRDAWESPTFTEELRSLGQVEHYLAPTILAAHEHSVNDCVFFPDGSRVVSASSDRSIRVWDAESGALRLTMRGHRRDVNGCAVNPEGTLIASVSTDQTIRIWDSETGECLTTLRVDGVLTQCVWFADGARLLAVGAGGLYVLELQR